MKDNSPKVVPETREPLLIITVPDTDDTRALILGLIEEDTTLRAATEETIVSALREPMLAYARKQAVRVKQGKL